MKKCVVFDLDGTLLDTLPDIFASVNAMLHALSYPERNVKETLSGIGYGSRYLIASSLPKGATEGEIDEALGVYREYYRAHFSEATVPYAGISDALMSLKSAGASLAVLSNKPDELTAALIGKWFPDTFDFVLGQGKYKAKPSPEAPNAVADALGTAASDLIFVGDSDVDVMTAHGVGARCVGVTWGYRPASVIKNAGADFIVDDAGEMARTILDIFEREK
ncbi:MAG: HAD-IA family hydrolase [Clostridia bacterium]|nr:HAD-IA family hydrolase [Clostridia bacterium]